MKTADSRSFLVSIPRGRENEKGVKTEPEEQGVEADRSDRMSAARTSPPGRLFKKNTYTCIRICIYYLIARDIDP